MKLRKTVGSDKLGIKLSGPYFDLTFHIIVIQASSVGKC